MSSIERHFDPLDLAVGAHDLETMREACRTTRADENVNFSYIDRLMRDWILGNQAPDTQVIEGLDLLVGLRRTDETDEGPEILENLFLSGRHELIEWGRKQGILLRIRDFQAWANYTIEHADDLDLYAQAGWRASRECGEVMDSHLVALALLRGEDNHEIGALMRHCKRASKEKIVERTASILGKVAVNPHLGEARNKTPSIEGLAWLGWHCRREELMGAPERIDMSETIIETTWIPFVEQVMGAAAEMERRRMEARTDVAISGARRGNRI